MRYRGTVPFELVMNYLARRPEKVRLERVKVRLGIAVLGVAVLVLRIYPPAESSFYPVCPFHAVTGLLCPGCGGTRALAALLHGNLAEAVQDNALIVSLLPLITGYLGFALYRHLRNDDAIWPAIGRVEIAALGVIALGFSVWRNLV